MPNEHYISVCYSIVMETLCALGEHTHTHTYSHILTHTHTYSHTLTHTHTHSHTFSILTLTLVKKCGKC